MKKDFRKKLTALVSLLLAAELFSACGGRTPGILVSSDPSREQSFGTSGEDGKPTVSLSLAGPSDIPPSPNTSNSRNGYTSLSGVSPAPTVSSTSTPVPFDPLEFYNYVYDFKADLSEYERYMNVQGEEYLILVNAEHPLSKDYVPKDLVDVVNTRKDRDPAKLRLYAEKAMEALYLEAGACGILKENRVLDEDGKYYHTNVLSVTHGYRSYSYQDYLYNSYVERDAKLYPNLSLEEVKKLVATYSCPPGTSEHQTGLCVDMHNWPTAGRYMADEFAASEAGVWLINNCYKFGFVLRFDKSKSDITGITYESWHFRYVGRFHATRMHELNMCLEEYCSYLSEYGYVINNGL